MKFSDHIAIEQNIRKKFFSKIEEAINNLYLNKIIGRGFDERI